MAGTIKNFKSRDTYETHKNTTQQTKKMRTDSNWICH